MSSCNSRRVLLQSDFDRFARLSHDDNPIHVDPGFAATSHFGATVAHGMLLYSCICKSLCEQIGPGVVQLEQILMFPNATYVGDRLSITLEQTAGENGVLELNTVIQKVGAGGTVVPTATGQCRVIAAGTLSPMISLQETGNDTSDTELYGLKLGMNACSARIFGHADLEEYGDLSGDRNPIFRDDDEARLRGFAGRIVPWPLLAGMFSDLLGTRLPGRGTGWMKQQLRYPAAAYPGEELVASVTITRLRAEKELVNLATRVCAGERVVCDGEALVLVRNLEDKTGAIL
jgi:acyl dehydratase